MKQVVAILVMLVMMTGIASQGQAVSEAALLFLMISPGARASGMGEAFVATADDATAVFWNPAGLAYQYGREITIMHANWLPQFASDMFYDFLAYRQDIEGVGTIGLNITYLNMGEQTITDESGPEALGTFSSYDLAFAGSYGTTITNNLALGVTLRYIRSNLAEIGAGAERGSGQANAFSFDVGLIYKFPVLDNRLSWGLNVSNMGPKIAYIDVAQADPLPTNFKMGFAYKLVNQEFNRLTIAADMNKMLVTPAKEEGEKADPFYKALITSWIDEPFKDEVDKMIFSGGLEYWYGDLIALRAGYYHDKDGKVTYATFGAGLRYSLYGFDFGYVSAAEGHPLSDTMRFSLTIGF
ncbi:type IX secretion system outer membrane channel protein PorV [candidate division KSB1 bacterium]|nr:type IX secretion system outer membrane channel protein PorV [candidate division KSB1 bacterium]